MLKKTTIISLLLITYFFNVSSQNEQDIQTLSIFSEYVKAKNYDAAYAPWNEIRQRNPKFNKAIFVYGERILKHKIRTSQEEEKIFFLKDILNLWKQRLELFPSTTPIGQYMAKACQLKYDHRKELSISKEDLFYEFNNVYETDFETFTNPKGLYTYFSLTVDMYDLGKIPAQGLFDMYDVITEKVDSEVKKYTIKRNSYMTSEGETKEMTRSDKSKFNSYNSYLKAYDQISTSIDTKLGKRANCENLIPLYTRNFDLYKEDELWLQRAMNRIYNKGCNEDPLFVKIVEKKNELSPNAETSFYLAILKEKSGLTSEALSYYNQAVDLESDDFSKAKILYKIATNFKNKGSYGKARFYYKKALKLNPSLGKAYLAIAYMYSKSANNCGDDNFSKRAVYWLAAKEASKASRVSPNLSKKASEYIANYSAKAPQKSEIFSSGKEGQIISVGCWIQRKVTVPNIQ
tara:strand:- start:55162 stop:56544 length:1383 start_codon:yes stop_codon:yes gene_type:complete